MTKKEIIEVLGAELSRLEELPEGSIDFAAGIRRSRNLLLERLRQNTGDRGSSGIYKSETGRLYRLSPASGGRILVTPWSVVSGRQRWGETSWTEGRIPDGWKEVK